MKTIEIDLTKKSEDPGHVIVRDMTEEEATARNQRIAESVAKKSDPAYYVENRREAYPFIGDQLDAIMKWLATETEISIPAELKSIAMSCMSVKAKYPKPTEEK